MTWKEIKHKGALLFYIYRRMAWLYIQIKLTSNFNQGRLRRLMAELDEIEQLLDQTFEE